MNLFAYGTLAERRNLARLTGRSMPPGTPATLYGYRRHETTLGYPIILPEVGATCTGTVYYNLTYADWERLDIYENLHSSPPPYTRRLVQVKGAHGTINAFAYIGNLNFFRTRLKP